MPIHDIIDNRTEKLIDHLSQMLGSCERARFAVGYLFLSGLTEEEIAVVEGERAVKLSYKAQDKAL